MLLDSINNNVKTFLLSNQIVALVILLLCVLWLWKKPYEFLKFLGLISVVYVGIYVMDYMGNAAKYGVEQKRAITHDNVDNIKD